MTPVRYESTAEGDFVVLKKVDYESLQDDAFKLQCLEGAGVDNWDGYDFAMEEYFKGEEDL